MNYNSAANELDMSTYMTMTYILRTILAIVCNNYVYLCDSFKNILMFKGKSDLHYRSINVVNVRSFRTSYKCYKTAILQYT